MDVEVVREKITADLPNAKVTVQGEDCNFSVTVVSELFAGKLPVARQRMVMAPFTEQLASGELHALSVKAITPEEDSASIVKLS